MKWISLLEFISFFGDSMTPTRHYLINLLNKSGHKKIADALAKGKSDSLTTKEKEILIFHAAKAKREVNCKLDSALVQSALVQVTSSGWGRESETTEAGVIQPLMNL
ncbi:hypothetical protein [Endozoicomonas lisbonensis]|uniref:Uncharacterized protein n=1 Tax=Endozoicomonas lisbonensis TaxID=3120522 RepID=A0ABV2SCT9_9GAMM